MIHPRDIYLSDLAVYFMRHKKRLLVIGFVAFVFFSCVFLFTLEPKYAAESSFRHTRSAGEVSSALNSILRTIKASPDSPKSIPILTSNTLLGQVIEEVGLQMIPTHLSRWKKVAYLLAREWRAVQMDQGFIVRDVVYDKQHEEQLYLQCLSENTFAVFDRKKKRIALGKIGEKLQLPHCSLSVSSVPNNKRVYSFLMIPKRKAVQALKKGLTLRENRVDNSIVHLSFQHPQRSKAIATLSSIMGAFQRHLHERHLKYAQAQNTYLLKRKAELKREYDEALLSQVAYLQETKTPEGYLGLANEIELFAQPSEQYKAKRHDLDLEEKKWAQGELIASADHLWKEGRLRSDQIVSQVPITNPIKAKEVEIYDGIDLESAQKLYTKYSFDRDALQKEHRQLSEYGEKVLESTFSLGALRGLLRDPVSQEMLRKGCELAARLDDPDYWSRREQEWMMKELDATRSALSLHIAERANLIQLEIELINNKMSGLQIAALNLVDQEKNDIDQKLEALSDEMGHLPEKWQRESQLKLQQAMAMQMMEGITQLSESKILDHNLHYIDSGPIDPADASSEIKPPHVFLLSAAGGMIASFAFLLGGFARAVKTGLPLNQHFFRINQIPCAGSCSRNRLRVLANIERTTADAGVVAFLGGTYVENIAHRIAGYGKKVLHVSLGQGGSVSNQESYTHIGLPKGQIGKLKSLLHEWLGEYDVVLLAFSSVEEIQDHLHVLDLVEYSVAYFDEEGEALLEHLDLEVTLFVLR